MKKRYFLVFLVLLTLLKANAQGFLNNADTLNKSRVIGVTSTGATLWVGSIIALNSVWYSDFDKSPFHFFNDSYEWGQMDKLGHAYSAFHTTTLMSDFYQWSGVSQKKSALIGALYGFGYLTTFEFLDAYNSAWGFSLTDVGFNFIGTALSTTQTYIWNERLFNLKFSVHNSGLADYRPNVLGNDFATRTLKDYNGQTYWLSFNPFDWGKNDSKIPAWINLSLGYGINNQLIGDGGTYIVTNGSQQFSFTPYRQYFLSLDIDFEKINTDSRFLQILFRGLNHLKIPFPTLELAEGKLKFHPLYF